jgi:hypothetical protein
MKDKILNNRANSFGLWWLRSDEFYKTAKILWHLETIDTPIRKDQGKGDTSKIHIYYRTASLLMGLSLETLAKAIIVKRSPLLSTEVRFPKNLDTHVLTDLFIEVRSDFNEEEKQVLNRLTAAIIWVSKYPVPKKTSGWQINNLLRNDNDFVVFEELRKKLLKIESLIPRPARKVLK